MVERSKLSKCECRQINDIANIKIEPYIVISYSPYIVNFFNFPFNILKQLNFIYFECTCVVCTHEVGGHPAGIGALPTGVLGMELKPSDSATGTLPTEPSCWACHLRFLNCGQMEPINCRA